MTLGGGLDSLDQDIKTINQANTLSEIDRLIHVAEVNLDTTKIRYYHSLKSETRALEQAKEARKRFGSRQTQHAVMSAQKTYDSAKLQNDSHIRSLTQTLEIVKKNEMI
jgi:hypothetical protein